MSGPMRKSWAQAGLEQKIKTRSAIKVIAAVTVVGAAVLLGAGAAAKLRAQGLSTTSTRSDPRVELRFPILRDMRTGP